MTGGCTRWERWSPRRGQRPKVLKLDFLFVLAAEIIQVSDSIAWVRCASGNACFLSEPDVAIVTSPHILANC